MMSHLNPQPASSNLDLHNARLNRTIKQARKQQHYDEFDSYRQALLKARKQKTKLPHLHYKPIKHEKVVDPMDSDESIKLKAGDTYSATSHLSEGASASDTKSTKSGDKDLRHVPSSARIHLPNALRPPESARDSKGIAAEAMAKLAVTRKKLGVINSFKHLADPKGPKHRPEDRKGMLSKTMSVQSLREKEPPKRAFPSNLMKLTDIIPVHAVGEILSKLAVLSTSTKETQEPRKSPPKLIEDKPAPKEPTPILRKTPPKPLEILKNAALKVEASAPKQPSIVEAIPPAPTEPALPARKSPPQPVVTIIDAVPKEPVSVVKEIQQTEDKPEDINSKTNPVPQAPRKTSPKPTPVVELSSPNILEQQSSEPSQESLQEPRKTPPTPMESDSAPEPPRKKERGGRRSNEFAEDRVRRPQDNERQLKPPQRDRTGEGLIPPQEKGSGKRFIDPKSGLERKSSRKVKKNPTREALLRGSKSNCRIDAVVFVIIMAQIIGFVAIALEIYAYALDQYWNKVLLGEKPLAEVRGRNVFRDKTFNLEGHEQLMLAREYATRQEPQEMVFIVLIILFMLISTVHVIACYIKAEDVEQYSALLIGLYAVGGSMCIICSTLLISASSNIENDYTYAADMLYNFQHIFDASGPSPPRNPNSTDCLGDQYVAGCAKYEYSKKQASNLEQVFRLCGDGSRFTRYSKNKGNAISVVLQGETYLRSDLKEIGFCSRDGFKIVASMLATVMGILCSVVPVIYCCESKVTSSEAERKRRASIEGGMPASNLPPGTKGLYTTNLRAAGQPDKNIDQVLAQFRTYVEAESDSARK